MFHFVKSLAYFGLIGCISIHTASAQWLGGGPLPPNNTEVKAIAKSPGGKIVIGTKTGGVFVSNNDVSKWETQSFGLPGGDGQDAKSIIVLENDSILVGTKFGVFQSQDNGKNFVRTSTGLENTNESLDARYLFQDPVDPNLIHLATKGGYYFSLDSGVTWTLNNSGLETPDQQDVKVVAVQTSPYAVLIGTKNGVFRLENPVSGTWVLTAPGVVDQTEVKAMVSNQDGSSIYMYAKGKGEISLVDGVYRSDDGGNSFVSIPIPTGEEVKEYGFAPSPHDPNEIMASDKKGNIFQSFDRGITWETITIPDLNDEIKALMREPSDPDQTWYVGSKNGFYITQNAGLSFKGVNEGLVSAAAEGKHVIVDPNNANNVYVATKTGLWFSQTGAETLGEGWVELTQDISTLFNLDIRRMLIDYANDPSGNTIYIAAKFDLFKYTDVGGSQLWIDSSNGIPPSTQGTDKDIKWIEQDPDDPSILYTCRKDEGGNEPFGEVFRSTDGGANWIKVSDDSQFQGELAGDPKNITIIGDHLYIGTKGGMLRGNKNGSIPIQFDVIDEGLLANEKGEIDIKQTTVTESGDLFAASKTGVYYLPNGNDTWIDITGNLPGEKEGQRPETEGIYFDPNGRLWVGNKKLGLFYTTNPTSGDWLPISDQLPEGKSREVISITTAPTDPAKFYVGTKEGTFTNTIPLETSVIDWRVFE